MKAAILAALFLSGCAQYGALTSGLRSNGAEVADSTRDAAQFTLCHAITIGAWVREYGRDEARARAWETICYSGTKTQIPTEK